MADENGGFGTHGSEEGRVGEGGEGVKEVDGGVAGEEEEVDGGFGEEVVDGDEGGGVGEDAGWWEGGGGEGVGG